MKTTASRLLAAALLALPLAALAHTGQGEHGFLDGFAHPFLGADHLLAMLVVGVWSMLHARQVWLAPLVFVTLLTIGALAGLRAAMAGAPDAAIWPPDVARAAPDPRRIGQLFAVAR